jgi:hypothetical protein
MEGMPTPENTAERIFTKEEIATVFESLLGDVEYKELRVLEDEDGMYLYEIEIPDTDPKNTGGKIEYSYTRKGQFGRIQASETGIHSVFYDENEIPFGGDHVAGFRDGEWKRL